MTIEINDSRIIDRQFRMLGLGMSVDMIRFLIEVSDEKLAGLIANAQASLPALDDAKAKVATRSLSAMEIETAIRAGK